MTELVSASEDRNAEQAVVGAMLVSAAVADDVAGLLRGPDFASLTHERVFDAIVDLRAKGEPADAVTVAAELGRRGHLDAVGGALYLHELVSAAGVTANAGHYAQIVRDKSVLRRLGDSALKIRQEALAGEGDASVILARSQALLDGISPPTRKQVGKRVADLWPGVVDVVERGGVRGPALPWSDLDQFLHGLKPKKLYVVGARPGVGKSMFAQSLMAHWADRHGQDVFAASYEMGAEEVSMRLLSAKAGVYYSKLVDGSLTERDWERVSRATTWPASGRIQISDDPTMTMAGLRSAVRELHRRGNLGLVTIDYAGIVPPRDPRLPRQEQVAEIARAAKLLAMEFEIPVVLFSQLNREVTSRGKDSLPTLTDLRESGALEQDADAVLLLHLPYDDTTGHMSEHDLHVIVAKNRDGRMGTCRLLRQAFVMRIVMREDGRGYREE